MSRQRIIITEVKITKAGQLRNFQIKMPKNAIAIVGVATDLRVDGKLSDVIVIAPAPIIAPAKEVVVPIMMVEASDRTDIVIEWNIRQNPLAGKIKLQSLEKANIFYSDQVWAVQFNDGIGAVTDDMYAVDAFAVLQKKEAKKVNVPANTTLINGMYKDLAGAAIKRDIAYTIKVLLWVETNEQEIEQETEK